MENIIGIWHDAEVLNGRGTRTEFEHEPVYMQGPVNKRESPCSWVVEESRPHPYDPKRMITVAKTYYCEKYSACSSDVTECSAFRNWSGRGDYKDADVMRFIRAVK